MTVFLDIVHITVCAILMFVVLLQQGKGGGMGAAFGGGAAQQVFGGRGAGNLLTRATGICAALFMLTSVSLAYLSSSGDRSLKTRAAIAAQKVNDKGTLRPKDAPAPSAATSGAAPSDAPPSDAPKPTDTKPSDTPAPAPH